MTSRERLRLRITLSLIALVGVLFLVRLYSLQIVHGREYRDDGEKQYIATVPNIYDRGTIYFQDKEKRSISAATLKTGYLITIRPKMIENPEAAYGALSSIIPLDHDVFLTQAGKKDDPYEEIAKRVSEEDKNKIEKLDIPGLQTFRERWRVYPNGKLAAHVLGIVGYQEETLSGRYGIERFYDDILSRNSEGLYVNFFADLFLDLGGGVLGEEEHQSLEGDVVLTIDALLQEELERKLAEAKEKWHASGAGGIIMDPRDGRIIAMAALPDFDPNQLDELSSIGVLANPLVEGVYEMGSTVKPLTMAAGIDAGAVTPQSTYTDTGSVTLDKKTFSNFDGKGRGPGTSMQEVLNQSLNTGVAHVVKKMGNSVFREYFRERYHLGDETGIDLPNEVNGLVDNLESRRDIEYATASFGQGIAMTPINVVTALASLGNGGKLVSPYIVDEIRRTDGRVRKTIPNPPEQILRPETSQKITQMLVTVVDKALLGGKVKMENYTIAAKTGTAQIARPRAEGGGYYDDRYMHTFFGYYPAYEPKFIVFLYLTHPQEVKYASETLTNPFMDLAKFILSYYQIPPDRGPGVVTMRSPR